MLNRQRAQLSMMALMAISLAIIVIVGGYLYQGRTEREIRVGRIASESTRELLIKLEQQVDSFLTDAMYETAYEMATHGGFISENVPDPNHYGVPYLFYRGKIVNVPSAEVMEQMYADEVKRRMETKIAEVRRELEGRVMLAVPEVQITIIDDAIMAKMELPVEVQGESQARSRIPVSTTVPLRIKRLRDLAERYVHDYATVRRMETSILHGITNDDRISNPPGGVTRTIPCEGKTIFRTKKELVTPFRENTQLSVSLELKRVRENKDLTADHLEWDVDLNPREIEFSFLANEDEGEFKSTDVIYFVPIPFAMFDLRDGLCFSKYFVHYDVNFPVRYTIRDIMPTAQVIGSETKLEVRPLEFQFYMMPLLEGEDAFAVDPAVKAPQTMDDMCQGSCSVDLTITNSDAGTVWLDSCKYRYSGGRLSREGVVCKLHTMVVEPDAQFSLAKHVAQVNIVGAYREMITLKPFATVSGSIGENRRVYCTQMKSIRELGAEPLGSMEGGAGGYVEVIFQPLSPRIERRRAVADEKGNYLLSFIVPGRYLVMAFPSRDDSGMPYGTVESKGMIYEVKEGKNTLDITLEPLGVQKIGNDYVRVSATEDC